jgi:hypothetical protein
VGDRAAARGCSSGSTCGGFADRSGAVARRTRVVAIQQEQDTAQLQEELEVTLEVVQCDQEELGHTVLGVGQNVPPVDGAMQGARPLPQEVQAGDIARQRAAEVHGWVPDPRR